MPEAAPNGLASLSAQRNRARRSMPPPRHPVAADGVPEDRHDAQVVSGAGEERAVVQGGGPASPAVPLTAVSATAATRPGPEAVPTDGADPSLPASRAPGVVGAPVKVTLYVNRDSDEFMEAVRVEGLVARPKVDVSRSAVVRLALRRLMSEMSAAEVKVLLEQQEVRSVGPGRKRR